MSLPWKPIDEDAARGVVRGTEAEKEVLVVESTKDVGEVEQFTIHSLTDDVFEDNTEAEQFVVHTQTDDVFEENTEAEQSVIHSRTDDVFEDNTSTEEARPHVNIPVAGFFAVPFHIGRRSGTPDSCSSSSMSDVSSVCAIPTLNWLIRVS